MVVDAGDVLAGIDGGVVPCHEPAEPAVVEDYLAAEAGPFAEFFQPAGCLVGGGAGELRVLVGVDRRHEVLAAGEGLLAFDLGPEP